MKSLDDIFSGKSRKSLDAIFADQPKYNQAESFIQGAAQGATAGFGDELMAGLISPVMYAGSRVFDVPGVSDKSLSEIYEQERSKIDVENKRAREDNPLSYMGGEIAGIIGTGAGVGATKAGTAIGNSIRTGGLGARMAKGAAAGAATGATYGAGTADPGERAEGAKRGAVYGAVGGGAVPAVGAAVGSAVKGTKNIFKGASARGVEQLDDALSAIKQKSSDAYKVMRDTGAFINKPRAINIANKVNKAIRDDGVLNKRLHKTTVNLLNDFRKETRSKNMTLEDFDQWRQLFSEVAGNFNDKINQRKARIAINAIDDAIDNLKGIDIKGGNTAGIQALKAGRAEWARARKFEKIADVIKSSEGDANYIKREFAKILKDPRKHRGFSQDELSALREASRLTTGEGVMKSLGKFGFDIGAPSRLGNTIAPVGAAALGAPGLTAAGTAARQGQKYLARGKAEQLLKTIEGTAKPVVQKSGSRLSVPAGAAAGIERSKQPVMQPTFQAPLAPRTDQNDNFGSAIDVVMDIEGGYVADDAGKGPSNFGINKGANPDVNVRGLTEDKAKKIYKSRYWNAINADNLPPKLALVGFDAAVNHGPAKARELLKKAGGDPMKLLQLREREYARLVRSNPKKYAKYADGWIARLQRLQKEIS